MSYSIIIQLHREAWPITAHGDVRRGFCTSVLFIKQGGDLRTRLPGNLAGNRVPRNFAKLVVSMARRPYVVIALEILLRVLAILVNNKL